MYSRSVLRARALSEMLGEAAHVGEQDVSSRFFGSML